MRSYFVTGANKGIGLAIVKRILGEVEDSFVFLGTRTLANGEAAVKQLIKEDIKLKGRIQVLQIDVADSGSILDAKNSMEAFFKANPDKAPLEGLVNNAGLLGDNTMSKLFDINVRGVYRVSNAFIPLLADTGRVVNMSSGAAPEFVQLCNEEYKKFFMNPNIEWEAIESMMKDLPKEFDNDKGESKVIKNMGATKENGHTYTAYSLSKALLNCLTMLQAKENPQKLINATAPGFILTDMTAMFANNDEKKAKEMGMKTPYEGAYSAFHLVTCPNVKNTGCYFGSDGKRSPLHKSRTPGSAPYDGSN